MSLGPDLSGFERDQISQRFLVLAERASQIAHQVAALRRRELAERTEGVHRFGHHLLAGAAVRGDDRGDGLAGRRVQRDERFLPGEDPALRARAGAGDAFPESQTVQNSVHAARIVKGLSHPHSENRTADLPEGRQERDRRPPGRHRPPGAGDRRFPQPDGAVTRSRPRPIHRSTADPPATNLVKSLGATAP